MSNFLYRCRQSSAFAGALPLATLLCGALLFFPRSARAQEGEQPQEAQAQVLGDAAGLPLAELLSRSELSKDAMARIDAAPRLAPEAQSTLWRLFGFLRRLQPELRNSTVDLAQLASPLRVSANCTGRSVSAAGNLQHVEALPLPPDLQDSFGTPEYFRCEVRVSDVDLTAVVYALQVSQPLRELVEQSDTDKPHVTLWGLVTHGTDDNTHPLTIVADGLLWRPQHPDSAAGIDARHVWLAAQGVDLVALRGVTDKSGLDTNDFTSFYQLLSAARHWDDATLQAQAPQWLPLGNVLQHPEIHRGNVVRVRGMARRIERIETERDVNARYDVPSYYEIALLTEVDPPIRIEAGDQSRLFSRYPVVVCAVSLPDGIPTGDVLEPIECTGVFLKDWAYPAAWLSGGDPRYRQLSPLIIARQPVWLATAIRRKDEPSSIPAWLAIGTVLLLIGFAWQVARWNRQSVLQRRKTTAGREPVNLDDLDLGDG